MYNWIHKKLKQDWASRGFSATAEFKNTFFKFLNLKWVLEVSEVMPFKWRDAENDRGGGGGEHFTLIYLIQKLKTIDILFRVVKL